MAWFLRRVVLSIRRAQRRDGVWRIAERHVIFGNSTIVDAPTAEAFALPASGLTAAAFPRRAAKKMGFIGSLLMPMMDDSMKVFSDAPRAILSYRPEDDVEEVEEEQEVVTGELNNIFDVDEEEEEAVKVDEEVSVDEAVHAADAAFDEKFAEWFHAADEKPAQKADEEVVVKVTLQRERKGAAVNFQDGGHDEPPTGDGEWGA